MEFDLEALPAKSAYKILASLVTPRPIALVTTVNVEGVVNAAPYSFFNVMGADPPVVVLGIGNRSPAEPKDTAANLRGRTPGPVSSW